MRGNINHLASEKTWKSIHECRRAVHYYMHTLSLEHYPDNQGKHKGQKSRTAMPTPAHHGYGTLR